MSKNRRILITSIIIGGLFSTTNINAMKNNNNKIPQKNQILTKQNKNIIYKKIPIFVNNQKNEKISKGNKILLYKNRNTDNTHSKYYVEKSQNVNNFNNNILFNKNLTPIREKKFDNNLTILEDKKDIEKLVNSMEGNRNDSSLFYEINEKINENNEELKKIIKKYRNAKNLEEMDKYVKELLYIQKQYENIDTFSEQMKIEKKLNEELYKRLNAKFKNLYNELANETYPIEIKKIEMCNKILYEIHEKYKNSKKLTNFEDELQMIKSNINDIYYLSFIHSEKVEQEMFYEYKKLCQNYINLRQKLTSHKIDIAQNQLEKIQKQLWEEDEDKTPNKEGYYLAYLNQINEIKNSLKKTIYYLKSEGEDFYKGIPNCFINDSSTKKDLVNLMNELRFTQPYGVYIEYGIMSTILEIYLNKLDYLEKIQLKYPRIINQQEIKTLKEELTDQIESLNIHKDYFDKISSNALTSINKLNKYPNIKLNTLQMENINEDLENMNLLDEDVDKDVNGFINFSSIYDKILEVKKIINEYEEKIENYESENFMNSTATTKRRLNRNLKNKKTIKNKRKLNIWINNEK